MPNVTAPPRDREQDLSVALPSDFQAFYAEHAHDVLVFFTRRTLDVETAADLTAETFAEALLARDRFRGSSGPEAAGWLYAIARHKLGTWTRKGVAERRAVDRLAIQLPAVSADDRGRILELAGLRDLRDAVAEEFAHLSTDQQRAVRLRIVEERSYAEIAQHLDVTEATARARVSRGLRTLAAALDGIHPAPEAPR